MKKPAMGWARCPPEIGGCAPEATQTKDGSVLTLQWGTQTLGWTSIAGIRLVRLTLHGERVVLITPMASLVTPLMGLTAEPAATPSIPGLSFLPSLYRKGVGSCHAHGWRTTFGLNPQSVSPLRLLVPLTVY